MKGSRRLVIDTSIAHAAGDMDATVPIAKNCRDFLEAVLNICHRVVFAPELTREWKVHASRYARSWQVAMERRHKIEWLDPESDDELRECIEAIAATTKNRDAMLKDAFLLEAALAATDRMVASLDDTVKGLFATLVETLPRYGKVVWINPSSEEDSVIEWLRSGAKPEPTRRLGYRPKGKR